MGPVVESFPSIPSSRLLRWLSFGSDRAFSALLAVAFLSACAAPSAPPRESSMPAMAPVQPPVAPPSPTKQATQTTGSRITASVPAGANGPRLFMELYRGPEPGEWLATSGGSSHPTPSVSLAIPEHGAETWLIRVDSRPPGTGPYSIALHRSGQAPSPSFEAASADRYEGDDSWFQATPLVLGEAQGHSLGASANPRGDEDWFVVTPSKHGL